MQHATTSSLKTFLQKNKIIAVFIVAATMAVVGTASLAQALKLNADVSVVVPASKEDCKKGGYAAYGFKNQGLCVSAVVRAQNGGYGG